MDIIEQQAILRCEGGQLTAAPDEVIVEHRVLIDVNGGQTRLSVLCLPRQLDHLAVGILATQGILRDRGQLKSVTISPDESTVRVQGDFSPADLQCGCRWAAGSACHADKIIPDARTLLPQGGAQGPGITITSRALLELANGFLGSSTLWKRTGAVHACGLAGRGGVIFTAEDVGRHNAFDKMIGRAVLEGLDLSDKFVLTTGRLSVELVAKAIACGLPMLVSRGAVTSQAVRAAKQHQMTLAGFARGDSLNVYAGFERILQA
ncbi:MAG: formate dehydrogenase accessory sulfurtransferase FdhD [Planctomycetes bacterium]|nr:formate dehydrogenase accessory sulfurtransferase FdhD [Planctomycetota bacterium]